MKKEKFKRYEIKYILDTVTAIKVRDFIEAIGMERDKNAPTKGYTVTSLYFDSIGLDDYYDKAGGYLARKKVRARIYGRDLGDNISDVHLEVKHKRNMFVAKDRIAIDKSEWEEFINGTNDKILDDFGLHSLVDGRVPTVVVRYKRDAYEERFMDRVRITFDTDIEYVSGEETAMEKSESYDTIPVSPDDTVMEIKFSGALPWWFRLMVRKFDLKREANSKYAMAVDAAYTYSPLPR